MPNGATDRVTYGATDITYGATDSTTYGTTDSSTDNPTHSAHDSLPYSATDSATDCSHRRDHRALGELRLLSHKIRRTNGERRGNESGS